MDTDTDTSMDILPDSNRCPEFLYSVTEEFLKKIQEALDSVITKFSACTDPLVLEAIMKDPVMNNLTSEELQFSPPTINRIVPGGIVHDDDADDDEVVMVDTKLEELNLQHHQLMEHVDVVSMSIDYLMIYYKMIGIGYPPRYDDIVSTLEWFVNEIDRLEKSYTAKLGSHPCDILSADNACLDLMINKFRQMKLPGARGEGGHQH